MNLRFPQKGGSFLTKRASSNFPRPLDLGHQPAVASEQVYYFLGPS